jgi:hypothetical protein
VCRQAVVQHEYDANFVVNVPSVVEVDVALLEFSKLSLLCILLDRSEFFIRRNFVLFSVVDR